MNRLQRLWRKAFGKTADEAAEDDEMILDDRPENMAGGYLAIPLRALREGKADFFEATEGKPLPGSDDPSFTATVIELLRIMAQLETGATSGDILLQSRYRDHSEAQKFHVAVTEKSYRVTFVGFENIEMRRTIIVAMTPNRLIGQAGGLPWHIPEDLKHFKSTTLNYTVIMGRKTFDELKRKPLPHRTNYIITRTPAIYSDLSTQHAGLRFFPDLPAALVAAQSTGEFEAFITGGAEIFRLALEADLVDRMLITYLHLAPEPAGDTWFPEWDPARFQETSRTPLSPRAELVEYLRNR